MADKEAAPATSRAIIVCIYPDFCVRAGSVAAYDIHAKESDDIAHSEDVQITGFWASNLDSRLCVVYSNSAADAGINSGCVAGFARPVEDLSSTVLVNNARCVRHDTVFEMNCSGPDGPFNTKGKMAYDRGGPGATFDANGQPSGPTEPSLSPEERAKLAEPEESWLDSFTSEAKLVGSDLADSAGEFWGGFSRTVNGALDTAISAGKVVGQFGAFVYQDATGQDPAFIFDQSELAAGEAAIGGTAEGVVNLVTSPIDTLGAIYDGSVDAFATAFERIAAGESAALAGELAGGGAIGLVTGGGAFVGAARLAKIGGLLDKARASGNLNALIDAGALNKLTPDEIAALRDAGKLDPVEAARATAKAIKAQQKRGEDGVLIHEKPIVLSAKDGVAAPDDTLVFRGDKRSAAEIHENGLQPKEPGAGVDLADYQQNNTAGDWVGSSYDPSVASNSYFTGVDGGVSVINQSGGIDVNRTLGLASTNPFEAEVAFFGGVDPSNIVGTFTRGGFIPNPGYLGPPVSLPPNPFGPGGP